MNTISVENFDKYCRWCLSTAGPMSPIIGYCLDSMFFYVTSLKVAADDSLPQQACKQCILKVTQTYNFIQMVTQNHDKLANIIKASKTQQITEKHPEISTSDLMNNDSDSESYALYAINMKAVETVDDDHTDYTSNYNIIKGFSEELSINPAADNKSDLIINESTEINNYYIHTDRSSTNVKKISLDVEIPKHIEANTLTINNMENYNLKCKHCPAKFESIDERKAHIQTHSERCKLCNKQINRGNAKRHARTHSSHRPHACRVCNQAFHDASNLHQHFVNKHCKEVRNGLGLMFLCSYCGKEFQWKTSLYRHIRHHTKKDLISCYNCKMEFTSASYLKSHLKKCKSKEPIK